jgi:hypothetical protein
MGSIRILPLSQFVVEVRFHVSLPRHRVQPKWVGSRARTNRHSDVSTPDGVARGRIADELWTELPPRLIDP